ncbi:TetR/AcrR family transcriptional regulator [Clostridium sp. PL3]|uniref:TetR/AcrR family transcriptional regulator n=1 Tax=Clostridium thailandense TaxID=2794346 RepID=A0A949U1B4_9CLOT|nr:TetR/AcrR family transcriptional regulator [Clostridium thailandense]MBV7275596.1 TetR/AcrR family transcriptional regulator [Clostridium thailandense]
MDEQENNSSLQPAKSEDDESKNTGIRRRGKILEDAILKAALDELTDVGYSHLTMEGVAARAKTNKAVIYRRWPNKAKLIISSLQKHIPKPITDAPNTGNLRDDVIILLRGILKPLETIGNETIHGLMVDLSSHLVSSMPEMANLSEDKLSKAMMTILKNSELRGEVNLEKISPRIVSLPLNLIRYEILTTHEPISDKTINEIVDDVFIPLVRL